MKKSFSSPSLSTYSSANPIIIKKPIAAMKKNFSVEALSSMDYIASTGNELEYAATKITLNQVIGCVVSSSSFPQNLIQMNSDDIQEIATCLAEPAETDFYKKIFPDWRLETDVSAMQKRYLKWIQMRKLKRFEAKEKN
jgi:hypothetical protein